VRQSKGRFEHMQTKYAGGWIHIFCMKQLSELCVPNIFKS
jgi:hypothetical protein